jgi:hypothetical protein
MYCRACARLLAPSSLQGSWNLRDVVFPSGSVIESWAFTSLVDPQYLVNDGPTGTNTFLSDLVNMCNKTGLKCDMPAMGPWDPRHTIEQRLAAAKQAAEQRFGKE